MKFFILKCSLNIGKKTATGFTTDYNLLSVTLLNILYLALKMCNVKVRCGQYPCLCNCPYSDWRPCITGSLTQLISSVRRKCDPFSDRVDSSAASVMFLCVSFIPLLSLVCYHVQMCMSCLAGYSCSKLMKRASLVIIKFCAFVSHISFLFLF